jgi:hypothetical protein
MAAWPKLMGKTEMLKLRYNELNNFRSQDLDICYQMLDNGTSTI